MVDSKLDKADDDKLIGDLQSMLKREREEEDEEAKLEAGSIEKQPSLVDENGQPKNALYANILSKKQNSVSLNFH